jgi:hypothetical protein
MLRARLGETGRGEVAVEGQRAKPRCGVAAMPGVSDN